MKSSLVDSDAAHKTKFRGLVVAHAAVNGGMMANFGRGIARSLVEEGADLHFFASKYPVFGWPPPQADLESLGGTFHGLPVPERADPFRDLQTLWILASELRNLGAKVLHTRGSVMGAIGRVAGRLAGVPVMIHHQDDLYCRDTGLTAVGRSVIGWCEAAFSRLGHHSLFVSQAVLRDALAIGFRPECCDLVGHDLSWVFQEALEQDSDNLCIPRHPLLDATGVPNGARVIGCIARLTPLKGIDILLESAVPICRRHPDWSFFLKGDGPMNESVRDAIREKGLANRFFLSNEEIPAQELPWLYRSFEIFALPTRREGFGMAFAEAMAMAVPVVGSLLPPVTEVVPEGCGLLVPLEDEAAFAAALEVLVGDTERRKQLGLQGREHVRKTLMGDSAARRVMSVYERLLKGSR